MPFPLPISVAQRFYPVAEQIIHAPLQTPLGFDLFRNFLKFRREAVTRLVLVEYLSYAGQDAPADVIGMPFDVKAEKMKFATEFSNYYHNSVYSGPINTKERPQELADLVAIYGDFYTLVTLKARALFEADRRHALAVA